MTVYKQRVGQPLKWLVAAIVFALALGLTFTDVYGYGGDGSSGAGSQSVPPSDRYSGGGDVADGDIPTAVPEPITLVLLAGGVGALYASRHRKKSK